RRPRHARRGQKQRGVVDAYCVDPIAVPVAHERNVILVAITEGHVGWGAARRWPSRLPTGVAGLLHLKAPLRRRWVESTQHVAACPVESPPLPRALSVDAVTGRDSSGVSEQPKTTLATSER